MCRGGNGILGTVSAIENTNPCHHGSIEAHRTRIRHGFVIERLETLELAINSRWLIGKWDTELSSNASMILSERAN